jgi:hypothetical protein
MKNEQLAMEILRELVKNAALTMINDTFQHWHARYRSYYPCCSDDRVQEAIIQLERLNGCFEEQEIKKIFDEAEERYRAEVDPKVWVLFKSKAEPAESDRPHANILENVDFLGESLSGPPLD